MLTNDIYNQLIPQTFLGGIVQAHIDHALIIITLGAGSIIIQAKSYRQIASGIHTRTACSLPRHGLSEVIVQLDKERVSINITIEPVEDTSRLDIDSFRSPPTLDVAIRNCQGGRSVNIERLLITANRYLVAVATRVAPEDTVDKSGMALI
ncbi:hypothetical protein ES703_67545 [subsurface metagenome]